MDLRRRANEEKIQLWEETERTNGQSIYTSLFQIYPTVEGLLLKQVPALFLIEEEHLTPGAKANTP